MKISNLLWQVDTRCWIILNALDTITTLCASNEFNPLINWLALTPQAFVIYKVGGTALALLFLYVLNETRLIKVFNIIWLVIIAVNISAIITNVAIDKISGS